MDLTAKYELEAIQKIAINTIYALFPDKHQNWRRRVKLRRQFQEEASFKSQYFVYWALSNFSLLVNRINQSSASNRMNYLQRLGNFTYLDPQNFLFYKCLALFSSNDQEPIEITTTLKSIIHNNNNNHNNGLMTARKNEVTSRSKENIDEKLHELKDTSELIADVLIKSIEPVDADMTSLNQNNNNEQELLVKKSTINPISQSEFSDLANKM